LTYFCINNCGRVLSELNLANVRQLSASCVLFTLHYCTLNVQTKQQQSLPWTWPRPMTVSYQSQHEILTWDTPTPTLVMI